MTRKMRPYQKKGKDDIFKAWEMHDIIMFVLATGGGKTFTFTEIIRDFLLSGFNTWLIAHREELIFQGYQTLYDSKILSGILKGDHPTDYSLPSQVMSIQTYGRRKNLPPDPDLIVIDEGHHVTDDNTYGKLIARYPNAKVLIVTATPYRLSGDGFLNIVPDKETFLIVNCTLKELIDDGYLVPLKYHIGSTPDMSEVDVIKGEYDEEQTKKVMSLAPIVESYIEHCNGEQGICFCVNVEHSIEVAAKYNAAGISAIHIDANTPLEDKEVLRDGAKFILPGRRTIIQRFKDGFYKVVCNVGILTEGTDFPICQFVQVAAPTKSLSRLFQEIGRATRALPGIVDLYETKEERKAAIAASAKPFAKILDNAGMWKEHPLVDEHIDWSYYFNGWKQDKKKKKDTEEPEFIDIPVYEIEDPATGARRKTKDISEVDGMILVELTHEMRRNMKAFKHIQEFERYYEIGTTNKKVDKPGYFAYFKFREHCDSRGIEIEDFAWRHLKDRLVDQVETEVNEYIYKAKAAGRTVIPSANMDIEDIRKKGVIKHWLKKEMEQYKSGIRRPIGSGIST